MMETLSKPHMADHTTPSAEPLEHEGDTTPYNSKQKGDVFSSQHRTSVATPPPSPPHISRLSPSAMVGETTSVEMHAKHGLLANEACTDIDRHFKDTNLDANLLQAASEHELRWAIRSRERLLEQRKISAVRRPIARHAHEAHSKDSRSARRFAPYSKHSARSRKEGASSPQVPNTVDADVQLARELAVLRVALALKAVTEAKMGLHKQVAHEHALEQQTRVLWAEASSLQGRLLQLERWLIQNDFKPALVGQQRVFWSQTLVRYDYVIDELDSIQPDSFASGPSFSTLRCILGMDSRGTNIISS